MEVMTETKPLEINYLTNELGARLQSYFDHPERLAAENMPLVAYHGLCTIYRDCKTKNISRDESIFITNEMRRVLDEVGFPMYTHCGCYFIDWPVIQG